MLYIESPYGIYQTIDWVAQAQLCTVVGPDRFITLRSMNIRTVFDLQQAVLGKTPDPDVIALVGSILVEPGLRDNTMRTALYRAGPPEALRQPLGAASVVALTRVILDDLHVHRLRQIWNRVYLRVSSQASRELGPGGMATPFAEPVAVV